MKFINLIITLILSLNAQSLVQNIISENQSEVKPTHLCLDQLKRGVALNVDEKAAWWVQNGENSKSGDQISIRANDFIVYRCPECYSFTGNLEKAGVNYQISAWTQYDFINKKIWMHYEQNSEYENLSFGMMLNCNLVH